jgi:hypothetical protein
VQLIHGKKIFERTEPMPKSKPNLGFAKKILGYRVKIRNMKGEEN